MLVPFILQAALERVKVMRHHTVMVFAVFAAAILATGATIQAVSVRRDRRHFRAPGRLVERLHVRDAGSGEPPVVFEAGISASSSNWSGLQSAVASVTRTISYDRPGVGWSPAQSTGCSLGVMVNALHRLTRALELSRPFVIVAHSFGSYIARVYAHRFRDDVAALVLIDPVTPEEWTRPGWAARWRLWRSAGWAYVGAAAASVGLVRLGLWSVLRRGGGRPGPLGVSGTLRRIAGEVAKLPAEVVPALRARWSEPQFFTTMARSIRSLPSCAAEAARQPIPADVPVTVISSARHSREELDAHAAFATRHLIVEHTGHWIHLDHPAVVVAEIRNAIDQNLNK
jgi:pimeloyl-ACP methyl ester carboxylesterase